LFDKDRFSLYPRPCRSLQIPTVVGVHKNKLKFNKFVNKYYVILSRRETSWNKIYILAPISKVPLVESSPRKKVYHSWKINKHPQYNYFEPFKLKQYRRDLLNSRWYKFLIFEVEPLNLI
jgi:hypothetical protein